MSNEDVGQAYLAVALKKPSDARRRKYKVWTENYADIFSGSNAEPHVLCLLICQAASVWGKTARSAPRIKEQRRKLINNGILHIARIAAFLWRKSDFFNQPVAEIQAQIATLQTTPSSLDKFLGGALKKLEKLINANPDFKIDVDAALKSTILETAITRSLSPTPRRRHAVPP